MAQSPSATAPSAQIFADDMSNPASGWGVGETTSGSAAYEEGVFQIVTQGTNAFIRTTRPNLISWPRMRVEATIVPDTGVGFFGVLCGTREDDLVGALASTDGGWAFVRVRNNEQGQIGREELASDVDAGLDLGAAQPVAMILDCTGSSTGAMRLTLTLNGQLAASHDATDGLASFDRVGLYAEGAEDQFVVHFDDVRALGGFAFGAPASP